MHFYKLSYKNHQKHLFYFSFCALTTSPENDELLFWSVNDCLLSINIVLIYFSFISFVQFLLINHLPWSATFTLAFGQVNALALTFRRLFLWESAGRVVYLMFSVFTCLGITGFKFWLGWTLIFKQKIFIYYCFL